MFCNFEPANKCFSFLLYSLVKYLPALASVAELAQCCSAQQAVHDARWAVPSAGRCSVAEGARCPAVHSPWCSVSGSADAGFGSLAQCGRVGVGFGFRGL